jgi:hypothetical protein
VSNLVLTASVAQGEFDRRMIVAVFSSLKTDCGCGLKKATMNVAACDLVLVDMIGQHRLVLHETMHSRHLADLGEAARLITMNWANLQRISTDV